MQRSAVQDRLPISVRDTITMGRWASRGIWRPLRRDDHAIVDETMGKMGLHELAGRRLADSSGGQRQRTLIAQALAQRAPILLLDEPNAGLDLESRAATATALADETARGTCVIVATHDTRTAADAGRCILLRAGRTVAEGRPDTVLTGTRYAEAFRTAAPEP